MRHAASYLVTALAALLLLPPSVTAQDRTGPQDPTLPLPPRPCSADCWWPVGSVALLDAMGVDVDVTDGSMVARYRFALSNPIAIPADGGTPAEGRIVFPVPAGSSVTDLVLSGGPETLEGRVLGAEDAVRLYEDIVRRSIDPALLRSLGDDLYEVRAFPVPAGETRQVSFTVTTPLLAEGEQAVVEIPWSRMSPRPTRATVAMDVDVPWEVRSALAPGYDLASERTGDGQLGLSWESAEGWVPDASFRLYLGGGDGLVATRLLAHRARGDDGYFALLFAPVVDVESVVPRDVVIVLDVSGSMEGDKLVQAKEAAAYVLGHLGDEDRFAIVAFSRFVQSFRAGMSPAVDAPAGIDFVDSLIASGGTNISGGLERGLGLLEGDRPGAVVFLTDGLPTEGITELDGIMQVARSASSERTQLFAFGVGYDVDTVLLDALSGQFIGSSHYVTPDERIDTEVQRLYERVSTPVLTDVLVTIDGVKTWDIAPNGMAGIFAGNQALLTGRYTGSGGATVTVTGNSAQGPETFTYEVAFPDEDGTDPTVAQLWAQRRVADLLTELRIEGTRDSLVEEIVDIATRFGIVTPFTSYLAEEPDLAFSPDAARVWVDDNVQAAPASGERAVRSAADLEDLRAGTLDLGGTSARVVGAHTWYLVDGTWVRDGYEPGTEAPEIVVGSDAFAALIARAPELAAAAALGERVVVEGPDGWVTIVWPELVAVE